MLEEEEVRRLQEEAYDRWYRPSHRHLGGSTYYGLKQGATDRNLGPPITNRDNYINYHHQYQHKHNQRYAEDIHHQSPSSANKQQTPSPHNPIDNHTFKRDDAIPDWMRRRVLQGENAIITRGLTYRGQNAHQGGDTFEKRSDSCRT